jgi:hypothetical protein
MKRVRAEGLLAMNETTLAQMLKRMKKKAPAAKSHNGNGNGNHKKAHA